MKIGLSTLRNVGEIVLVGLAWWFFGWKAALLMFLLLWHINVTTQSRTGWLWSNLGEEVK